MEKERALELLKKTIAYAVDDSIGKNCIESDEEIINLLFTIGFTEEELMEDLGYSEELIDRANALLT